MRNLAKNPRLWAVALVALFLSAGIVHPFWDATQQVAPRAVQTAMAAWCPLGSVAEASAPKPTVPPNCTPVPLPTSTPHPACPDGFRWNASTNQCEAKGPTATPAPRCEKGFHWDSNKNKCVENKEATATAVPPINCPKGTHYDWKAGGCVLDKKYSCPECPTETPEASTSTPQDNQTKTPEIPSTSTPSSNPTNTPIIIPPETYVVPSPTAKIPPSGGDQPCGEGGPTNPRHDKDGKPICNEENSQPKGAGDLDWTSVCRLSDNHLIASVYVTNLNGYVTDVIYSDGYRWHVPSIETGKQPEPAVFKEIDLSVSPKVDVAARFWREGGATWAHQPVWNKQGVTCNRIPPINISVPVSDTQQISHTVSVPNAPPSTLPRTGSDDSSGVVLALIIFAFAAIILGLFFIKRSARR